MDYLIVSTAVIDQISYPNSCDKIINIGGAGYYALSGARIWEDSVFLSCGKGIDFDNYLSPIFKENNISTQALFNVDLKTPTTLVEYDDSGERVETPVYGGNHYQKFVSNIKEIEKHSKGIKGLYVFKEANSRTFFNELKKLKEQNGFNILWEISSDTATKENIENIKHYASFVDIFSINKSECKTLFECEEKECIENLKTLGYKLIFFREGSKGSTMITKDEEVFTPSVESFKLVDPTGAGNSSSAAVLVGYCNNKSLLEISLMGSISAGFIIGQSGAPKLNDPNLRIKANEILEAEIKKVNYVR